MRKIIFLDIDGVLNTSWWHSQFGTIKPKDRFGYPFDPNSCANLAKIVKETGADIVISSSWKCWGLSVLKEMWRDRKLPGRLIDITPNSVSDEMLLTANLDEIEMFHIRGAEIKEWLLTKGQNVSHYVIIDDMDNFLPEQQTHFVWTNPDVGITKEDAEQAIMILKNVRYAKENTCNS